MSQPPPSFKDDLRISVVSVILLQIIVAAVYIVPVESSPLLSARLDLRVVEPVLFILPMVTLALYRWNERLARWFAALTPIAVVIGIHHQLAIPGILVLLSISTGLAAGLLGLRAAFGTAVGAAAALLLYRSLAGGVDGWQLGIALIAILSMLLLMVSIIRPARQVSVWAWSYYQKGVETIEENRQSRGELNQALDDLAHANRQLALLYEKQTALQHIAEEAERTKSSFVAKVSHEFRTPLNMIIGLAAVMIENPHVYGRSLPAEMMEDLRIIHRNCEHLASLINDVLALSQAQSGQMILHREMLPIGEIIGEALDVVRPLVMKKKLSLALEIPSDLQDISCDRTRIRQVILNLLSNAARFTDHGGIVVQVEDQPNNVLVLVRDSGPGILPDDMERIFEPFCQGSEKAWRDKGGSGLGLTISKQFVELHGGKIWLESQTGAGTTFFVSLPKNVQFTPQAGPTRWISREWPWVERRPEAKIASLTDRPRVVLCDPLDGQDLLIAGAGAAVEIESFRELNEALASVHSMPAHVVLLRGSRLADLRPMFDRARKQLPDTPLVGCVAPQQVSPALQAGADRYLVKPIHPSALREAIQHLQPAPRSVLIADDDTDARRLIERMVTLFDAQIKVEMASTGAEALRILCDHPVDLLLLDLVMPEIDGLQVLQSIRADAALSRLTVFILSAQDPSDFRPQCQEMLVAFGDGIDLRKTLECALGVSEILFNPHAEAG